MIAEGERQDPRDQNPGIEGRGNRRHQLLRQRDFLRPEQGPAYQRRGTDRRGRLDKGTGLPGSRGYFSDGFSFAAANALRNASSLSAAMRGLSGDETPVMIRDLPVYWSVKSTM